MFYFTVKIRYLAVDESMKKLGNEVNVSMDIIVSTIKQTTEN